MIYPFSFLSQIEAQTLNHGTDRLIHYPIFPHILHLWLKYVIYIHIQLNRSSGIINNLNISIKRKLSRRFLEIGDVLSNKKNTMRTFCTLTILVSLSFFFLSSRFLFINMTFQKFSKPFSSDFK